MTNGISTRLGPIARLCGVTLLAIAPLSCGGPHAAATPSGLAAHEGALHWYPLDAGMQWVYMVKDSALEQRMMSVTKVTSVVDGVATVQTGQDRAKLRVVADGIVRDPAGGYLLKTPPRLGDRWPAAEGAEVSVTKVDARITVEAGTFEGCFETRERFPDGETLDRTFCPEVGPVRIEATGLTEQGSLAVTTATLRSFGMPQSLTK